jgi:hypothetical protein
MNEKTIDDAINTTINIMNTLKTNNYMSSINIKNIEKIIETFEKCTTYKSIKQAKIIIENEDTKDEKKILYEKILQGLTSEKTIVLLLELKELIKKKTCSNKTNKTICDLIEEIQHKKIKTELDDKLKSEEAFTKFIMGF